MAGALVARKVGLTELDDDFVRREPVQSLFERVHVTPERRLRSRFAGLRDDRPGRRHDATTASATKARRCATRAATRELPLADGELRAKFVDCLRYGRYEGDSAAFFEQDRHAR